MHKPARAVQERWNVPNADYVQPKTEDSCDQRLNNSTAKAESQDVRNIPAQHESTSATRPSEGMNAEELWKAEANAKVRKSAGVAFVPVSCFCMTVFILIRMQADPHASNESVASAIGQVLDFSSPERVWCQRRSCVDIIWASDASSLERQLQLPCAPCTCIT